MNIRDENQNHYRHKRSLAAQINKIKEMKTKYNEVFERSLERVDSIRTSLESL